MRRAPRASAIGGQGSPGGTRLDLIASGATGRSPRRRRAVGAEGGGGEPGLVVEVGRRVVGPAVADRVGPGHLRAGDDDGVAVDRRLGPGELAVLAGDDEPRRLAAP